MGNVKDGDTSSIANLTADPGPDGVISLRETITAANNTPGADTIEFSIPGPGPHTIQPTSALPTITDPVIINGTTQPGFASTPIIELDGSNAGPGSNGLKITAGNTTVLGLVINGFDGAGIRLESNGGNVIAGCFIGTDVTSTNALGNSGDGVRIENASNNTIGLFTPTRIATPTANTISGNRGDGIHIEGIGATGNKVQASFIGTDVTGTAALGNYGDGVRIKNASDNVIGLFTPTDVATPTAIVSGNRGDGIHIEGLGATGNKVQASFIGTDVTGTAALRNSGDGVRIEDAPSNTIGGTRNLISGNGGHGVEILGSEATGNVVQGNFIGTDKDGTTALGNSGDGVRIENASNNTINMTNTIAFNGGDGVSVLSGTGDAISRNSIFNNADLGIDLWPDGVTSNDFLDLDAGANELQNFPVLTQAISEPLSGTNQTQGRITIGGTLHSTPNTTFRLEFFSNTVCNGDQNGDPQPPPDDFGEGETYLDWREVRTNGEGNVSFNFAFPPGHPDWPFIPAGYFITATATDPNNNTSEFSRCIEVVEGAPLDPNDKLTNSAFACELEEVRARVSYSSP